MVRTPSQSSDFVLTELRASKGALEQRWRTLTTQLGDTLNFGPRELRIDAETQAERVWAGLEGGACERVPRNRGLATRVVPICDLPKNLSAWLGLQEVWDVKVGNKPFVFRHLALTVHFGYVGDPIKPQVIRLEWSGVQDWTGVGLTFQTPGAGHPHWQFDILQSLEIHDRAEEHLIEPGEVVEQFDAETSTPELGELLRAITLENMHFASAARWWMPSATNQLALHMNAPPDLAGLTRWLISSVNYVKQELARCQIRRSR